MSSTLGQRSTPQSEKRQEIERNVLAATAELLDEGATYAELNIERIAKRAGISRTAFYFYFRDKRELLMRLTEEVAGLLYDETERWWAEESAGATELRIALQRVIDVYTQNAALLRAVVEVATYDDEVATFWRELVGRFVVPSRDRIQREQAAGRGPDGDAEATAFALAWMTERTLYQQVMYGDAKRVDLVLDALVEIWMRASIGRVA